MWPLQSECDAFYGNPRGLNGQPSQTWMRNNLVRIDVPFRMTFDGQRVSKITIHKKCADSLSRILQAIWIASGHNQARIEEWGVDKYGGSFNFRLMRGLSSLSMHSWGCAIDIDPARNGLGDPSPYLANCPLVIAAFDAEKWTWGGRWNRKDGMHFQAARVA